MTTSMVERLVARLAAADLASRLDYSCLVIGDVLQPADGSDYRLDILEIRRFAHGPYVDQVAAIAELLHDPVVGDVDFGYDFGGVGAAVGELFKRGLHVAHQRPYQWVGGMRDGNNRGVRTISKQNNVRQLQRLLGERRLGLPPIPERKALMRELAEFRVVVSPTTGYESFSGGGAHDDMVMSLLLLTHMAERSGSGSVGVYIGR